MKPKVGQCYYAPLDVASASTVTIALPPQRPLRRQYLTNRYTSTARKLANVFTN